MITGKVIQFLPKKLRSKVENNMELRAIMGNINWLTFENILRSILGVLVFAWVARYLGPEDFGLMNYAVAFVALFSTLSTLGLDNIVIRNIVSDKEKKEKYLGSALMMKFVGSLLMLLVSFLVVLFLESENTLLRIFVVIISSSYIFKSFDVIDLWFQSQIQSRFSVYARSISFVIVSSLKILFVLTNAPIISFVYIFVIETFIVSLLLIYFYTKKLGYSLFNWRVDIDTIKSLLKDSWPLMLGAITAMIYMKIDQVMIGNILGKSEVGYYYSAVKLSETWYFLPAVIGSSVFPAILNARRKSEKLYKKRLQLLFDLSAWFAIATSLIISLSSKFVIEILYGVEYLKAAPVLSVHIWSGVFVFLGIIASKWVIAENYTGNALIRSILAAILNIVLNIFLIREFGIMGAAISTLVSYAFINFLSLALFKKTRVCFKMQIKSFNIFRFLRLKL